MALVARTTSTCNAAYISGAAGRAGARAGPTKYTRNPAVSRLLLGPFAGFSLESVESFWIGIDDEILPR